MTKLADAQEAITHAENAIIQAQSRVLDVGGMLLAQSQAQLATLKAQVAVMEVQATQAKAIVTQCNQAIDAFERVTKTVADGGEVDAMTFMMTIAAMLATVVHDVAARYVGIASDAE